MYADLPQKTIIFVADIKGWAFDSIAQYVKSILCDEYDCHIIYTSDFTTYEDFLKSMDNYSSIDLIHFFYRGYLAELIECIARLRHNTSWLLKFKEAAITTHIPDHLFIDDQVSITRKLEMFNLVDNYYTASQKLYEIYSNINEYPSPHSVIYDNIQIPQASSDLTVNRDQLTVIWLGNSAWGEWIFGKNYDFKGLKTIVEPAFNLMQEYEPKINKVIIDGATQKLPKQTVLELLKKADIVLISSKNEGTPLPLIEAMAHGCAVISTDVGIVREVLPQIQQEFVVKGTPEAFATSIKKLNLDRDLLLKIKTENYATYNKVFGNSDRFKALWRNFIEDSINNSAVKLQTKENTLLNPQDKGKLMPTFSLRRLVRIMMSNAQLKTIVRKLFRYRILHKSLGLAYAIFEHIAIGGIYGNFKTQVDALFRRMQLRQRNSDSKLYAIYPNRFPGVANSTRKLFHNTLSITSSRLTEYNGLRKATIDKIARLLIEKKISPIVMSGGSIVQLQLTQKLHELNPAITIHYLWHGSPAQWCDQHHYKSFAKWMTLYKEGKIQSIITLKKDLEKLLKGHGIKTALLQNFIPIIQHKLNSQESDGSLKIGVWSAYNTWIKNLYPQFMAISMVQKVECYTNFCFSKDDEWIMENVKLHNYPKILPHRELLELMNETDITLYVTNSECSPMIAIESISMGIPCIVGPTSGFYDCDEFLREKLTVSRVDCPVTIHAAIERARDNLADIKARIPDFIIRYNKIAQDLKKEYCDLAES